MWVVAQFSFHANRGPLLAPLGRFLVVAAIVALINFAQIADSQNIDRTSAQGIPKEISTGIFRPDPSVVLYRTLEVDLSRELDAQYG